MKIAIGSDHGGFHLKEQIKTHLRAQGVELVDVGTDTDSSVDYPDIAEKLCKLLATGEPERGILICGTGIGISIAANKMPGIRAALCGDVFSALMSRQHNDANVLCLGERTTGVGHAEMIVDTWLNGEFLGDRHTRRVNKIMNLEKTR
ncbi:MAG: ribose 5-phosphate isomerase B [Acidaminococcaceae bacterium]